MPNRESQWQSTFVFLFLVHKKHQKLRTLENMAKGAGFRVGQPQLGSTIRKENNLNFYYKTQAFCFGTAQMWARLFTTNYEFIESNFIFYLSSSLEFSNLKFQIQILEFQNLADALHVLKRDSILTYQNWSQNIIINITTKKSVCPTFYTIVS